MKMFQALPAYFGGKRKLLGSIFKDLPGPDKAPTFVDPFMGGGSVSLYAKALGYRVLCNDVAARSHIVGKALIENSTEKISPSDLVRLSVPLQAPGHGQEHLAPDVFPEQHAEFLDRFVANAGALQGSAKWLALLLVIKHALQIRPRNHFGAKSVIHQAAAGEWEEINPNYVKAMVTSGFPKHPVTLARTILPKINAGVFGNGQENEAHQGDAIEFLGNVEGDVCYMDPPYPGTQSYERAMHPLDELLTGGPVEVLANPYSSEPPDVTLPKLFEAAAHFPTLVFSYGNARIDLEGLMALMKFHRPNVVGVEIDYAHCVGLSTEESKDRNLKLLVIGRNK